MDKPPGTETDSKGGDLRNRAEGPFSAQRHEEENLTVVRGMAWNTPFPPAEFIQEFSAIGTGYPKRLFNLFEGETLHRRRMESRTQTYPLIIAILGRVCALIVVFGFLGLAALGIIHKTPWISAVFGGTAIVMIVMAFLRYGLPNHKGEN